MKRTILGLVISGLATITANASPAYLNQLGPNIAAGIANRTVSLENLVLPVDEFEVALAAARSEMDRSTANIATVKQTGFGHMVAVQQTGTSNYGLITQSGAGNAVALVQVGSRNIGLITQAGFGNSVSLTQTGSNHAAMVTQQGRGNVAIIAQR
jgi:hypothetical protein